MAGLELATYGHRQVAYTEEFDHSVAVRDDRLHQQRLQDRDKHHHRQLWTKDAHGGQYRKV